MKRRVIKAMYGRYVEVPCEHVNSQQLPQMTTNEVMLFASVCPAGAYVRRVTKHLRIDTQFARRDTLAETAGLFDVIRAAVALLGANSIINFTLDLEFLDNGKIEARACGTAVTLEWLVNKPQDEGPIMTMA